MAAIDSHIVVMLRTLINDLDESDYTYTDSRLEQTIAVAAMYVNKDLDKSYFIDVNGPEISPNPYTENDLAFINLIVLKSACIIDQGTFRVKAAVAGLMAKAGPATLQTGGHLDGFKTLLALGPCGAYKEALTDYKLGSGDLCHIIMSPFISDDFDPQSMGQYIPDNERYIR